jgi:signal transduction histidine kinase
MTSRKTKQSSEEQIVQTSIPTPDEAPNPVIRLSATGKTLYSNPKARSIPGLVDPKTNKTHQLLVKTAKASFKNSRDALVDYEASDKCFEMYVNPVADLNHINIYGRDVTEARVSVANISSLAKFPGENPNPVLRTLPNGNILFANEAARALRGAVFAGPPEKLSKVLAQAAKSASRQNVAVNLSHKSENEIYFLTFAPVDGEKYLNVYGIKITAEIEAQEALEESNALLERRVAERTASVRLLQNIVLAANNADSLEAALQTALHEVCIYTGWQVGHAYVVERHEGKNRLISTGLWHFDTASKYSSFQKATEQERFGGGKTLPGEVLKNGKVAWVEHLSREKKSERLQLAKKSGLASAMAFPVLSDGAVVGVLEFFSKGPNSSNGEIVETMGHIGTQLGSVAKRKNSEITVTASQADAAIAHSRLSNAIEVLGQGFALFDVDDNLVLFNKRYSEFMAEFGAPEPEVGDNFEVIVRETTPMEHENDTPIEKEAWVQAVIKSRRENNVYESIDRTGTGRWLRAEGFDTEEGGTVSIFTDISETKKHEQEQAELAAEADLAHSRLNVAIEAIGQGFALFDADDKYVLFNKKYQKMKRTMGEEAIVGVSFEDTLRNATRTDYGDETRDQWIERIIKSREDERAGLVTDELGDGSWFLFERYETAEKGKVDVFTDVTEMKNHEAELDTLVKELGIARDGAMEANSAKSQFLANMSHELRTPLNAIIGYSELLIDDVTDDESQNYVPDLEKIQSAGKHLLGLINDILDLSKIEVGKVELFIEEIDVKNLLDDVSNTIKTLVQKNRNSLDIRISKDVNIMHGDITKLRQNLFNLLSNAAKFSNDSVLSVRTSRKEGPSGDLVVFEVADKGIGMTPEHLDKVFDPFTQADSSTSKRFGGSGLGLTITRNFSRMMGGDVTVASEFGVGTTFTMTVSMNAQSTDYHDEVSSQAIS